MASRSSSLQLAELRQLRRCHARNCIALIFGGLSFIGNCSAQNDKISHCASTSSKEYKFGRFDGQVQLELLGDGRRSKLLKSLTYVDPCGTKWVAPEGAVVDGASIPQIAWSFIGGPWDGPYRDASVIHDVACETRARAWSAVHEAFFYAMLTRGTPTLQAKIMYAAVYHFGPRWPNATATVASLEPRTIREDQFAKLVEAIKARETGVGAVPLPAYTLRDIQQWKPETE